LQRIAHHQGESFAIITVKAKLAPMGLDPSIHARDSSGAMSMGDGRARRQERWQISPKISD
ncbi:hypothetical protein, partial [Rhizobium phaseoli]|uniref:hypothetical protein n=1 Tax=Rhizobium phaseoli TaxID=396 RepID=UPI001AEC8681